MEIVFEICYDLAVVRDDIPKLTKRDKSQIQSSIEHKLTTQPEIFGKPLRRSLKNLRKLRVGDHRVIFQIKGKKITIYAIQHRSVVYQAVEKRK